MLKQLQGLEQDGLVQQDGKGGPWRRTTNPANPPNPDDSELGRLGRLGDLWDEEERRSLRRRQGVCHAYQRIVGRSLTW